MFLDAVAIVFCKYLIICVRNCSFFAEIRINTFFTHLKKKVFQVWCSRGQGRVLCDALQRLLLFKEAIKSRWQHIKHPFIANTEQTIKNRLTRARCCLPGKGASQTRTSASQTSHKHFDEPAAVFSQQFSSGWRRRARRSTFFFGMSLSPLQDLSGWSRLHCSRGPGFGGHLSLKGNGESTRLSVLTAAFLTTHTHTHTNTIPLLHTHHFHHIRAQHMHSLQQLSTTIALQQCWLDGDLWGSGGCQGPRYEKFKK